MLALLSFWAEAAQLSSPSAGPCHHKSWSGCVWVASLTPWQFGVALVETQLKLLAEVLYSFSLLPHGVTARFRRTAGGVGTATWQPCPVFLPGSSHGQGA